MLNLDTHMVVALLEGDLTEEERTAVLSHRLSISAIVNWELAKLVQLGRLEMDLALDRFRDFHRSLVVFPITLEIAVQSTRLDFQSDPADELIAAASIVHQLPLLTRDRRIRKSRLVRLVGSPDHRSGGV